MEKVRYHTILSTYFCSQPHFCDGELQKKPSIRKCVELPFQQTQAELWNEAIDTLCNLNFIESKCIADMVFELMDDYFHLESHLPENQLKLKEERLKSERIERWNRELADYSRKLYEDESNPETGKNFIKKEISFPEIPAISRFWTSEEIEAESRRIIENPDPIDILNFYKEFVISQGYLLIKNSHQPGFILQHAFNYKSYGPVHTAAENTVKEKGLMHFNHKRPPKEQPNSVSELLLTLEVKYNLSEVNVTTDGRFALSIDNSFGRLNFWNLVNGQCLMDIEWLRQGVASMSPEGKYAVVAGVFKNMNSGEKKCITWWDVKNTQCLKSFDVETFAFRKIFISADGLKAATLEIIERNESGMKNTFTPEVELRWGIRLWDLLVQRCIRTIIVPAWERTCISVTSDLRFAISIDIGTRIQGHDQVLLLWDLMLGHCLKTIQLNLEKSEKITSINISPNGKFAMMASGWLGVWDLDSGQCVQKIMNINPGYFSNVITATPNGQIVATCAGNILKVWDLKNSRCLKVFEGHSKGIAGASITADAGRIISWGSDLTMKVWNLENGQPLQTSDRHKHEVTGIILEKEGREAVTTDKMGKEIRIWNIKNGECRLILGIDRYNLKCADLTPNGLNLVTGGSTMGGGHSHIIQVWDLKSGQCIQSFEGVRITVDKLLVTPDGMKVVTACSDRTIRIWDLQTGNPILKFEGHSSPIAYLNISASGKLAFSAGGGMNFGMASNAQDCTVRVWDIENSKCLWILQGHTNFVSCVMEIPGKQHIISGSWDHSLRIWDLHNGNCVHVMEKAEISPVKSSIRCLGITPDGRFAISGGSMYGKLHLWDLENGKFIRSFIGHEGDIRCISVTPNGQYAVSGATDNSVRIWELNTGNCKAIFPTGAPIESLAIFPDPPSVVCGTTTGEVIILELVGIQFD